MRKILASMMAAALCLSLAAPAFAATGYGDGTSGGGGSYTPPASTGTGTPTAPSDKQVNQKADAAIKDAIAAGGTSATVNFQNVTTLTAASIKAVAEKAAAAKTAAIITVDKVVGKSIASRWYLDPAKAANMTGKINMEVKTDAKSIAGTAKTFDKYYANELAVVSLGQKGSYGMTLELAVKVDLTQLDASKLLFYSYDKTSRTFAQIQAPAYVVDSNGYLHFNTSVGGDILITDSTLTKK